MAVINKNPEYFLTIAKERNISKAAEMLYISQSYLSQHISKLEASFDVKLFDRTKTPIELTEAGEIYLNHLQADNLLYTKLTSDFDALNKERANVLNLGIAPWRGSTLLPDILPAFMEQHENVKLCLFEQPTRQLFDLIEKNSVDIAIMNVSVHETDKLAVEFIKHEKILLAACRQHPKTQILMEQQRRGQHPDIEILRDECFILMKYGMSCAEWIYNYLDNLNFAPAKKIVTSSKTTAYNLVAQNLGFSFIPETGIHWVAHVDDMIFFDLESNDLIAPLAVVHKKNSHLSLVARDFIRIAKAFYGKTDSASARPQLRSA